MKTRLFASVIGSLLLAIPTLAQDKTTVTANSSDISDNLDLKAVASIFGDASNLEDFERRLNDPKSQISNLDLNNDNQVDYLRVVESVEGRAHIIVIQAVLEKDVFQDVATVELEKDSNNKVQIQVVGDVYMYGSNYIYEPIYVHTPVIYTTFWVNHYRPYYSSWYWNYYPSYYHCWSPFPIFRYRNNISIHINFGHSYNYVSYRRCHTAYNAYYGRRGNGYEMRHPNRSFSHRNSGYSNRYEMDSHREIKTRTPGTRNLNTNTGAPRGESQPRGIAPRGNAVAGTPRNDSQPRATSPRGNSQPRVEATPRGNASVGTPRNESQPRATSPRGNSQPRVEATPRGNASVGTPRNESQPRTIAPRGNNNPRVESSPRGNSQPRMESPRSNNPRVESSPRGNSQPRMESQRGGGSQPRMEGSRGNSQPRGNGGGSGRGRG
ncbi:hypothetical protein [Flavobacterium terrigena]|uniref:DUF3300 domain-containing protein n=1 Tax=Flavobacterium terrigena TaxID=402734 RepID=A0A1H6W803_9FLAO|nr:hypothetical protein [Flavobacterium terrigena]SEJ13171.1 hypothetical protein SAMN05660918_2481 [Flavobacterium terrigena]